MRGIAMAAAFLLTACGRGGEQTSSPVPATVAKSAPAAPAEAPRSAEKSPEQAADEHLKDLADKTPAPSPPKTSKSNQLYLCMNSETTGPHMVPKGVVFDSWGPPYHTLRDPVIGDGRLADGPQGPQLITVKEVALNDAKPCAMVAVQRLVGFGNTQNGPISAYPPRAYQASWSGLTDQGDEKLDDLIYGGSLNGVLASDVTSSLIVSADNPTAEIQRKLGLPEAAEDKLERQAHNRASGYP